MVAPYERWQYYNENVQSMKQEKDYAANKTKQVAWFVSNCGARYDLSPIVARGMIFSNYGPMYGLSQNVVPCKVCL